MLILLIVVPILHFGRGGATTTGEAPVGAVHITVAELLGLVLIILLVLWLSETMGTGMLR